MKSRFVSAAFACALLADASGAAAALTKTQSVSTPFAAGQVMDSTNDGASVLGNSQTRTVSFLGDFSSSTGVLTGASVAVSAANPGFGVSARGFHTSNDNSETLVTSQAFMTLSGATLSQAANGQSPTATDFCLGTCNGNYTTANWNFGLSAAVSQESLVSVATGGASYTISTSQSVNYSNTPYGNYAPTTGFGVARFANPNLTATLNYSYLKHARAALDIYGSTALTLDFGDVLLGSDPTSKLFGLFNFGDANTVSLDLDAVGPATGGFSVDLTPSANFLMGGGFKVSEVTFAPTAAGLFSRSIVLQMSDADVGYGMQNSALTLNLRANVIDPVPEPGEWAMMASGLGVVGAVARRRARRTA